MDEPIVVAPDKPFSYLQAMFHGQHLTDEELEGYNPRFIDRVLTQAPDLVLKVDKVNTWNLDSKTHYYVLMGFLKGKSRYIQYQKKSKAEDETALFIRFKERLCMLFGWSAREFMLNIFYVKVPSVMFTRLCQRIGFTEKEETAMIKELTEA